MEADSLTVFIDESGHSGRRLHAPEEPLWLSLFAIASNDKEVPFHSERLARLGKHAPKAIKGNKLVRTRQGRDFILEALEGVRSCGGTCAGTLVNKLHMGCALMAHTLLDGEHNPRVSCTVLDFRGELMSQCEPLQWWAMRVASLLYNRLRHQPQVVQDFYNALHGKDVSLRRRSISAICSSLEKNEQGQVLTIGDVILECKAPELWLQLTRDAGGCLDESTSLSELLMGYNVHDEELGSLYCYAPQVQAMTLLAKQLGNFARPFASASLFHDEQKELLPHIEDAVEGMKLVDAMGDIWSQAGRSDWISHFGVCQQGQAQLIGLADWGASLVRWIATNLTSPDIDEESKTEAHSKMGCLLSISEDAVMAVASVDDLRLLFSKHVDSSL